MVLRRSRTWTVKCPPAKKRVVAGKFIATPNLNITKLTRRVTIEIYGPSTEKEGATSNSSPVAAAANSIVKAFHVSFGASGEESNEDDHGSGSDDDSEGESESESDLIKSANRTKNRRSLLTRSVGTVHNLVDLCKDLHDEDYIIFRIFKPRKPSHHSWGFGFTDYDDTSSEEEEVVEEEVELKEQLAEVEKTKQTSISTKTWLQDALQRQHTDQNPYHKVFQQHRLNADTENWMEYRKCGLDGIVDDTLQNNKWEATVGLGNHRERREFLFDSQPEAEEFVNQLEGLRALVKQRAQSRLQAYQRLREQSKRQLIESFEMSTTGKKQKKKNDPSPQQQQQQQQQRRRVLEESLQALSQNSEINLLLEIVSASDIPITDRNSTDPYVSVYMGATKIHRTKSISKE
jgi:hypothetical protein